jgi:uncharacterized protein YbjT (DUF2867 family)
MRIVIAGGTGTAGRVIAEEARRAGHEAVTLSRHPSAAAGHMVADLLTGSGLDLALSDADAVIDASNIPTSKEAKATAFFTTATQQLLAAEERTGVPHHLTLSIVGIDRMPTGYYRAKLAQEAAVRTAAERTGVGFTIARVTQFHDFVQLIMSRFRRGPVVVAPPLHLQPVDLRDVARHLLHAVQTGPAGRAPDLGGPRPEELPDMVRRYAAGVGARVRVLVPPMLGPVRRANQEKVLRPAPPAVYGTYSFDEWLTEAMDSRRP